MSAFIDDFYDDNAFNLNTIEAMLNSMLNLQDDYDHFMVYFKDLEGSINQCLYLNTLDDYIPVREVNIMIERMNHKKDLCVSKYGIYRDCEDYIVKTDWFFNLSNTKQFEIRFDFYSTIVLGIHQAFYRV